MVWLLATRDLLPHCDLDIMVPASAGVIMHFVSVHLRDTPAHLMMPGKQPSSESACIDTVTVIRESRDRGFTSVVPSTCVQSELTTDPLVSPHDPNETTVRIRLTVGGRDEQSIVGYQLKFNIYLSGNWTSCPYPDQFLCKNDDCIWENLRCDETQNCLDNSDEYRDSHALCAHSMNLGLEMIGFLVAAGTILVVLLTLDAVGREMLRNWRLHSKVTQSTTKEPHKSMFHRIESRARALATAAAGYRAHAPTAVESEKKAGKEESGKKEAAPPETTPFRAQSPHQEAATARKAGSSLAYGSMSHRKTASSIATLTTEGAGLTSTPSGELDFDGGPWSTPAPYASRDVSIQVEDDKPFASDRRPKSSASQTSKTFGRLLKRSLGKSLAFGRRGTSSSSSVPRSATTPSRSTSLESSTKTSPVPDASETTPSQPSLPPPPLPGLEKTGESGGISGRSDTPSPSSASRLATGTPRRTVTKTSGKRGKSSPPPSSSSISPEERSSSKGPRHTEGGHPFAGKSKKPASPCRSYDSLKKSRLRSAAVSPVEETAEE
ncbi:uncharacterized protein LOC144167783 [Haemaphysalis longicornis]